MSTRLERKLSIVIALVLVVMLVVAVFPAPAVAQDTPAQGRIVFTSSAEPGSDAMILNVINPDGTGLRQLDTGQDTHTSPRWSADGWRVLLGAQPSGFIVFDLQTEQARPLGIRGLSAAWSPDERRLIFSNEDRALMIAEADGSNALPLSFSMQLRGVLPSWSPDGRQILFDLELDTRPPLYVLARINADGTDLRVLDILDGFIPYADFEQRIGSNKLILRAYDGEWSPDGDRIVFWSDGFVMFFNDAEGSAAFVQASPKIEAVGADGSDWDVLTVGDAAAVEPSWSPDGSQIVFVSMADGDREICVMDADGSNVRQLTHNRIDDFNPDWGPMPGSVIAPQATPSSAEAARCTATASRVINLRSGPGTTFEVARQSTAGETLEIDGQAPGADGFIWYRLTTSEWAREDVIDEAPDCLDVPRVP